MKKLTPRTFHDYSGMYTGYPEDVVTVESCGPGGWCGALTYQVTLHCAP